MPDAVTPSNPNPPPARNRIAVHRVINLLIWLAAIGMGIWAWVQGAQALQANPPPMRSLVVLGADGQPLPGGSDISCAFGTAFIEGETVWRYPCLLSVPSGRQSTETQVAAQLRFADGVIQASEPFTQPTSDGYWPDQPIQAFARHADGRIFLHSDWVNRIDDASSQNFDILYPDWHVEALSAPTEALSAPTEALVDTRGAAWVGDSVQLVTLPSRSWEAARELAPTRYTYSPDGGWSAQAVTLPEVCTAADANCRLQLAYYAADSWRLLYLDLPAGVTYLPSNPQPPEFLELSLTAAVLADDAGNTLPLALESNRVGEAGSETLVAVQNLFDQSVANLPNTPLNGYFLAFDAMPYTFTAGSWQPVPAPPAVLTDPTFETTVDGFFIAYTHVVQQLPASSSGTGWQVEFVDFGNRDQRDRRLQWVDERWLLFRNPAYELSVEDANAPTLPLDIDSLESSQVDGLAPAAIFGSYIVVPAADGGYWLNEWLRSDYLRLTPDLQRADLPTPLERIMWHLGNMRGTVMGGRWPSITTAAVLIGLPLLILLLLVFRQRVLRWGWAWLPAGFIALVLLGGRMLEYFLYDV